ncbi:MAG: bifunctional folylpolyglutamate synthase/dihydrofolate synthase [Planctomycetota bacterium]|nr:bifunctional folylpolyglutamate synthase/dihydrofolate synthase [Planctomycetota bacterium]
MASYSDAVAYLDGFVNYERAQPTARGRAHYDLSRIEELAERLGNPQRGFPSLHVAGTKGKGSCCAFAASILREAGYRVGLYTSPHLVDLRERIQLDGKPIAQQAFAELVTRCRPYLEEMRARPEGSRRPTYFEILTHVAFMHFAERAVDVAVVEVGMGGRLDATNIVRPAACGITRISRDHTAILGGSLDRIAREKAGILKLGVPAVSAPQPPEAARAIEACAARAGAPLEFVGRELDLRAALLPLEASDGPLRRTEATLTHLTERWTAKARLGLHGTYQGENWAVAVRLAQRFAGDRIASSIEPGSRKAYWPGRLEVVENRPGEPVLILDGAHNDESVGRMLQAVQDLQPGLKHLVVLLGCAKDKDAEAILRALALHTREVVFTQSSNPRARSANELALLWKRQTGLEAQAKAHLDDALGAARQLASAHGPNANVVITGSLYLVGDARVLIKGC